MFQLVFNAEGPVIKIAVMMKGAELTSEESYSLPYALEPEYLSAWRGRARTFGVMDRCPPTRTHASARFYI